MIGESNGAERTESGRVTDTGLRLLALPVTLTLMLLAWQAWHAYASFRASDNLINHYEETEAFRTLAYALENRKQMSAQLGAVTAQSQWTKYYHNSVTALEAALEAAVSLSSEHPNASPLLDRVKVLHRAVTEWEERSIRLVLAGDLDGAAKTLLADEYIRDRAAFRNSVDAAVRAIREDAHLAMREDQRLEILSFSISSMLVVLAVLGWILLLQRLLKSRARLSLEIDQRLEAEGRLRNAQKMEAVARLAGGVAHDFKNVLVIIGGNLKTAMAHLDQHHRAAPALKSAKQAADHAQFIIRRLLALGRRSSVARSPVDAATIVHGTLQLLKELLPPSIEIAFEADQDFPLWLLADRTQIEQALINLALNARDAMPQGGRLTIRAFGRSVSGGAASAESGPSAESVCIEVIDTGTGMTPEVLKDAFEPFFTTRPKEWGTGLGLSIVQNVATDHGGKAEIVSQPGTGTKVTLCLPASAPPLGDQMSSSESDLPAPTGSMAVVQTNPYLRELLAETLQAAGFNVIQADVHGTLHDVIAREKHALRLVIIEVAALDKDTSEMIDGLRAGHRSLPIILVTESLEETPEHDFGKDVIVLCKPFPMPELVRLARQLAARSAMNWKNAPQQ